jgi:hypothetical protein
MVQRQFKPEAVDENTLRLAAPNLPAFEVALRPGGDSSGWLAAIYRLPAAEGEHKALLAESPHTHADRNEAWQVGFELLREAVVV